MTDQKIEKGRQKQKTATHMGYYVTGWFPGNGRSYAVWADG